MSTQPFEGGRRPIDRILAPGFMDAVGDLSFADLRERRRIVEQEEVDLSYARRLLQGRLDLLRAEQAARARGDDDEMVLRGTVGRFHTGFGHGNGG